MAAPPVHVATTSAVGTGTAPAGTVPAGVAADDFMLAFVGQRGITAVFTPPSGWVSVRKQAPAGGNAASEVFKKLVTTETGGESVTFSSNRSDNWDIIIEARRGCNVTTPINAENAQDNASSTSVTAPSITTTVADCALLFFGQINNGSGIAPAAGYTERADVAANGTTSPSIEASDTTQAVAGATGTVTATGAAAATNAGYLFALAPVADLVYQPHYQRASLLAS